MKKISVAKKIFKTKIGKGLTTHGLAAGAGAVAGSQATLGFMNFDPYQRRQNQKMRKLQKDFNKKVTKQIEQALKEKGYVVKD